MSGRLLIFAIPILIMATSPLLAFNESPVLYRGLRPLGMGNAFIAVSDDENTLFYNPAGLNDIDQVHIDVVNPTIEVSFNVLDIAQTILDISDDLNAASDASAATDIIDTVVDRHLGDFTSIRTTMAPGVVTHNFGLLVPISLRGSFAFRNQVLPNIEYQGTGDAAVALGIARGLKDKLIQWGVVLKPGYRLSTGVKSLGVHNYTTFNEELSDFDQGIGVYSDVGFKSHLEVLANMFEIPHITPIANYLKPAFGLTVQNIPFKSYSPAKTLPFSVSAGTAFHADFWKFKNTLAIDVRDINQNENTLNKLAIGVESIWNFSKYFRPGFRAGFYQARPTAGFSLDFLRLWRVHAAIYHEEVGEQLRRKGDLRVALMLTLLGWH